MRGLQARSELLHKKGLSVTNFETKMCKFVTNWSFNGENFHIFWTNLLLSKFCDQNLRWLKTHGISGWQSKILRVLSVNPAAHIQFFEYPPGGTKPSRAKIWAGAKEQNLRLLVHVPGSEINLCTKKWTWGAIVKLLLVLKSFKSWPAGIAIFYACVREGGTRALT